MPRVVDQQALGYDFARRHARREGAERILKHQLKMASQRPHLRPVERHQVTILETHPAARRKKSQDGSAEGRFA